MAVHAAARLGEPPIRQPAGWRRPFTFLARHPWVITAVLCVALLVLPVTGGDLAAQEFYTWVIRGNGLPLWNDYWYAGHLLPGYSPLFPPIAALIGTRPLGALACVGAAAAAAALLRTPQEANRRPGARLAGVWFAVGCLGPLVVGQLPFELGFALGLAALLAVRSRHPWLAVLAALGAGLSSPLAGAFLLLAALAWASEIGLRRTSSLVAAVVGIAFASALGGGGYFPFPLAALLVVLLFCGGGLILMPHLSRPLRLGLVLYGGSALALFAVQNPVGGNVTRLGALVGGPLAAALLGSRRRWWTLAVVAVPLLCWQVWPGVTALSRTGGDPSSQASYYAGLTDFLRTQDVAQGRVEVPTLRQHWEAYYVAKAFPLARGWDRQIDLRYNAVLYRPGLTADQLHDWLLNSGVGLVALPDVPLDHWSQREGALLAAGQPWLQPVYSDKHWRVWRVTDSGGLVTGSARLTHFGVDSFQLTVGGPGSSVVRVHWSPYWQVTSGQACLRSAPGGWLSVESTRAGPVTLTARWSLSAALGRAHQPSGCGTA